MDRRVLGSGAIVGSAMVLWSQQSAPEQPKECPTESATVENCANNPRRAQPRIVLPDLGRAIASLPPVIQWGNQSADRLPAEIESLYGDLLKQAQETANQSKFAIALSTVAGIPRNSQHYERANQLQETWSQELLQRANDRAQQGDIDVALSMVTAIPTTSDRYNRATELRERWKQQADLLDQARVAKERGDWGEAVAAIESLKGTPLYASLPVQQLLQQAIYRTYQSDDSLMQITGNSAASSAATGAAMPTVESPLSDDSLPNLPSLPIDVDQAMAWAQPVTPSAPSIAAMPMPSQPASPIATLPAAPSPEASIAPSESVAALPINKTRSTLRLRPTMAENHSSDRDRKLL